MEGRNDTVARSFAAIDFETATYDRDSACAVGVAIVEEGSLKTVEQLLIRPPTERFTFTHIHGLTWADVKRAPTFREVWTELSAKFGAIEFFAAHNAGFDRSVLDACCARYGLERPPLRFVCTVRLARSFLGIRPASLPNVCRCLGVRLRHHEAASDAEACARIVLAAMERGWTIR